MIVVLSIFTVLALVSSIVNVFVAAYLMILMFNKEED